MGFNAGQSRGEGIGHLDCLRRLGQLDEERGAAGHHLRDSGKRFTVQRRSESQGMR